MINIGLDNADINAINAVFKDYSQIESVLLYGSRAKNTFRVGSDIDLTIVGESVTLTELFEIEQKLDDLLLPWKIDLSLFHKIENKELIDHINRVGIVFYS
nr:nucleotidyltransferase domain-containing protein [Algoriphagus locisalis]